MQVLNKNSLGSLLAVISGAAFGTYPVIARIVYDGGASVLTLLSYRYLGAVLLFGAYLAYIRRENWFGWKVKARLIIFGMSIYASTAGLFLLGVTKLPVSLACLLLYLYPSFVMIYSILSGKEAFSIAKVAVLLINYLGLVLVLGWSFEVLDRIGLVFAISAAVFFSAYMIIGDRLTEGLEPFQATGYIITGALLSYSSLGFASGTLQISLPLHTWMYILLAALVPTILGVVTFWLSMKMIGPVKVSLLSTLEPIVTIIMAWMIFGETLSGVQILGSILVVAGIILIQLPGFLNSSRKKESAETKGG